MYRHIVYAILFFAFVLGVFSMCQNDARGESEWEQAYSAVLGPYQGPHAPAGTNRSTLTNKVMCGYQGWFRCEGDGSDRQWTHYIEREKNVKLAPGNITIDLWPDTSELSAEEKFATSFNLEDGSTACLFSSIKQRTVLRHFEWMRDAGIDGVFLQRFPVDTIEGRDSIQLKSINTVLRNCRDAANQTGRTWALMYDLSGLKPGQFQAVREDWKQLMRHLKISRDPGDTAYQMHGGKPVISLWGLGFEDRAEQLDDWRKLIEFFKNDPEYGRCSVILGVPMFWRTLDRDCISNPKLHDLIRMADIISPWTVTRYENPADAEKYAVNTLSHDITWCHERKLELMPVVFPGFSWHNVMQQRGRGNDFALDQMPRLGGRFFWTQCAANKRAGASMFYVAMFDEMDEGTAIFKCTNKPPVGASRFVTYEGLPSDHYLWLAGQAGRLLRGELPATNELPLRTPGK